jgi:hypothetical protein
MRCLAGSALLFGLVVSVPALAADTWSEFKSSEGGFAVMMPGQPKLEQQQIEGATAPNNIYGVQQGDRSFVVSYHEYAPDVIKRTTADRLLAGAEQNTAEAIKGTVRADRNMVVGGHQAREVVIDKGAQTMKARYLLAGSRLYQVVFLGAKGAESGPDATKFLDSFRLTTP